MITVAENAVVLDGLKGFSGDFRGGEWCGVCRVGDWVFGICRSPAIVITVAENAVLARGLVQRPIADPPRERLSGDFRGGEWCGVCRVGDWVFVNLQKPGITFATSPALGIR